MTYGTQTESLITMVMIATVNFYDIQDNQLGIQEIEDFENDIKRIKKEIEEHDLAIKRMIDYKNYMERK